MDAMGVAMWGVVYTSLGCGKLNNLCNGLFAGIVFLQHTEKLDDVGILVRNEQQISDLKGTYIGIESVAICVRYSWKIERVKSLATGPVET
jgi:hypothetical protein